MAGFILQTSPVEIWFTLLAMQPESHQSYTILDKSIAKMGFFNSEFGILAGLKDWFSRFTQFDPYAELVAKRHTEIHFTGHSWHMFPKDYLNKPHKPDQSVVIQSISQIAKSLGQRQQVIVSIPETMVFAHDLEIPRTVRHRSWQLSALELARVTPFDLREVYLSSYVHPNGQNNVDRNLLRSIVVRKTVLAETIEAIRSTGAKVTALAVRSQTGALLPVAIAPELRPFNDNSIRFWWRAAGIGALASALLFGFAMFSISSHESRLLASIATASAVAQGDAAFVRKSLEDVKIAKSDLSNLDLRRRQTINRLRLIERLSATLQSDVFLQSLLIENDQATLDGAAKAPETLISLLEKSKYVSSAVFAAPIQKNPNDKRSHFTIKLGLLGDPK